MKKFTKFDLRNYLNEKKFYSYPLNLQINIIIGFIILLTITLITTITYANTLNHIKQNFKDTGLFILKETAGKINSRLSLVENTVLMISNDSRILSYNDSVKNISESEINKYLNSCININVYDTKDASEQGDVSKIQNLIDDIIFVTNRSSIIAKRLHFTSYNIRSQINNEWFRKAYENKGRLIWTNYYYNSTAEQLLKTDTSEHNSRLNQFMLIRYIVNEKNFDDIGYVAVSINLENLSKLVSNIKLGKNGKAYVIDDKGKILASEDKSQLLKVINFDDKAVNNIINSTNNQNFFEGTIGKEEYFIFSAPISINNWKLIVTIPVSELKNSVSSTLLSVIIIGIISFIIITFISTLILNNMSLPLKKILMSIKEIRNGNLSQRVDVKGCMEVNQLSTEFNYMLDTINSLLDKIVDEQKALRKSELKALRAQINPHFLYNTLDSMKWLIISGNNQKASQLIASLSTFFRIGLSGGSEEIKICEEVEHAKQYLFIQKLRCGDTMDYIIDIDSDIENFRTPKLILQPIIENAIFHGLNRKECQGFIKVVVKKKDEASIQFEIIDNGIGMTQEGLDTLNEKINNPLLQSTAGSHGYAMRNVNQRIKLGFGDEYGVSYESKYNIGTKVTVILPIIRF